MIRSVLAVLAGYLVTVIGVSTFFAIVLVIAFGGHPPADGSSMHPPGWLIAAEILASPLIAIAGGYVCAWLAKRKEIAHGLALAGLMLVLGVVTAFADAGHKPLWSTIAVVLAGAAGAIAGARLRIAAAA